MAVGLLAPSVFEYPRLAHRKYSEKNERQQRTQKGSDCKPSRTSSRLARLVQILALISQRRIVSHKEIMKALGISRRTFFRDVIILKDAGVAVGYSKSEGAYTATTLNVKFGQTLSEKESAAILLWGKYGSKPSTATEFGRVFQNAVEKITRIVSEESQHLESIVDIQSDFSRELKALVDGCDSIRLPGQRAHR